jgi:hypothetical protein
MTARPESTETGCPGQLKVLGVIPGGKRQERAIHAKFAHLRSRGEWFQLTDEVLDFLEVEAEEYDPDVHNLSHDDAPPLREWDDSLKPLDLSRDIVFTLEQASATLDIPKGVLSRDIRSGSLRATRRAGRTLILGRWLLQWVEGGEVVKPPPAAPCN